MIKASRIVIRKALVSSLAIATVGSLVSCGKVEEADSEAQERLAGTDDSSWSNATLVDKTLAASRALRVNKRTNYVTYYENGTALSKWKIATGRAGKPTPSGIFAIHTKQVCPPWNNGKGLSAAACAANNPLGAKALWFYTGTIYGLHGVDLPNVSSVTDANARNRDKSSGCVRNHPQNIEWVFAKVSVGTPVVVGTWNTDPTVVDCSGDSSKCVSSGTPGQGGGGALLPSKLPAKCALNVSPGAGIANIRSASATSASVVGQLGRNDRIELTSTVVGASVNGSSNWYTVNFGASNSQSGFIHSSLVDCTR